MRKRLKTRHVTLLRIALTISRISAVEARGLATTWFCEILPTQAHFLLEMGHQKPLCKLLIIVRFSFAFELS